MGSLVSFVRSRNVRRRPAAMVAFALVAACVAVVGLPQASALGGGATVTLTVEPRNTPEEASNPDFIDLPDACRTPEGYLSPEPCRVLPRKPGAPLVVVWGDSHAWMLTPAIRKAIGRKNVNMVSFLQGACPPMNSNLDTPQGYANRNSCDEFGHDVLDYLRKAQRAKRPVRLILAMSWELYHNAIDPPNAADRLFPGFINDYIDLNAHKAVRGVPRLFRELGRMHVKTDVVGQMPMVYGDAPRCPRGPYRCALPRKGTLKDGGENLAYLRQMRDMLTEPGFLIRPARTLCNDDVCKGTLDGVPVYYDRLHVGQRASYKLASHFEPSIEALLREDRARKAARR